MKIKLENYDISWPKKFAEVKSELLELIGFLNPKIEHIGSTSVEGLSAKPIIDILVGLENENDLDKTVKPLIDNNYVYYEKYNKEMSYRRFFVKHKAHFISPTVPEIITDSDPVPADMEEHNNRLAHIHILVFNSEHWIRHKAFRDYLRTYPKIKNEYQRLKEQLKSQEWHDGNEYNKAKDKFIKEEEQKAINWYNNIRS